MWILQVCIGILWGGMCEQIHHFEYPSQATCEFEMKRANTRLRDGYAVCVFREKK